MFFGAKRLAFDSLRSPKGPPFFFKGNRGGRCLAASQTVTSPDSVRSRLTPLYGLIVSL